MTIIGTFPNADKNNLIPPTADGGSGLTIESLTETWSRYDFTFHGGTGMTEGVDDFSSAFQIMAGLIPRIGVASPYTFQTRISFTAVSGTDVLSALVPHFANGHEVRVHNLGGALPSPLVAGTSYFVRDLSGSTFKLAATSGGAVIDITTNGTGTNYISNVLLSVEWTRGTPVDGGSNYLGLPGTVTEIWRSYGIEIPNAGRLDVDVGFSRTGPRYSILLSGSEIRGYVDYAAASGRDARCIVSGPSAGFPFPLRLGMHASQVGAVGTDGEIRDVMLGGNLGEKSILSLANKLKWGLMVPFTADSTTNILTSTMTLLADGHSLRVTNTGGTLPSPLVAGTPYFVRDLSGNTFKLAATSGGAAIDLTTNGTGTNYLNRTHLRIYQTGIVDGFPVDIDL